MLTKMEKDKESYSKSKATMMELTIFYLQMWAIAIFFCLSPYL